MSTSTGTDIKAMVEYQIDPLPTNRRPNFYDIVSMQTSFFTALTLLPMAGQLFGHAFLVCRQGTEDWNSRTNNAPAVAHPVDPGPLPNIPAGTHAFDERRLVREHEADQKMYLALKSAHGWFMSKIILVGGIYITALKHETTGYTNVTPARFFAHLYQTYGRMTDALLQTNLSQLDKTWNPMTEQIEALFSRQMRTQQIAANDDPISNRTMIRQTKQVLAETGVFTNELREWDTRIPAHQTWTHFVNFFTEAHRAFQESPAFSTGATAQQAGYNANAAQEKETNKNPCSFGAYCWSHGFSFDTNHTSATCRRQAPGHQTTATLENMMGGSARLSRRRGETAIFRPPQRRTPQPPQE